MSTRQTYPLHIGPTHPAFKEPVQFNFEIEGERVITCDIEFGYTHRAVEHIARERNFIQILYLLERICGICSVSHPMAYCLAVEQAAEIEVPPRAKYIRTIIGELERLHSHLLWTGVAAHEIGFDTLFLYTWNIREKVLDCLETITGNRINYGILTIGGVRRDITPDLYPVLQETLDYYYDVFERAREIILDNMSIQLRCKNVGILSHENALAYCAVGPTARASGVPRDVRVDYPVNAYPDIEWLKPVSPLDAGREPRGDVYDRMIVRVHEIHQSIDIINFCMENMPEGAVDVEPKATKMISTLKKVQGEGIGRYEAPRGEVSHYDILDNREGPLLMKVKAPTYSNGITWMKMFDNVEIADIPIVIASIDPCVACADRMSFVDSGGRRSIMTSADLHRLSVEKQRRIGK